MHSRRQFIQATSAMGLAAAFARVAPAFAQSRGGPGAEMRVGGDHIGELVIAKTAIAVGDRIGEAVTMNGTVPGPILRFREGETVTLRVTNRLDTDASIHWHGILLPTDMDGVPGLSFRGIAPGETFTYHYKVRQYGTYWYHSHSGFHEQLGQYAPLLIDRAGADPIRSDREHVIVLSDWTFRDPHRIFARLKKESDAFNFQKQTVPEFLREAREKGLAKTWNERAMWWRMRMSPTDILDVTGSAYVYLMNGLPSESNWTGLFRPGERVRLRLINSAAQTYFNVRIPGLRMTVVQADGQDVEPVTVDELQIAVAETYDIIVTPQDDRAYTVFAESLDRSGYVRGTLAPREGMQAEIPALRERPLRGMVDMGMDMKAMDMQGMDMKGMDMKGMDMKGMDMTGMDMTGMDMKGMDHGAMQGMQHGGMQGMNHGGMQDMKKAPGMDPMQGMDHGAMRGMDSPIVGRHGPDHHGAGNSMVAEVQRNRLGEPGTGLENVGHRVLVYNDLKSADPPRDPRAPSREIEIHLTGNMEAFIWGMDGKRFSDAADEPFRVKVGERVRVTLVNDTMMEHPMHLHGVFMELDNGAGARKPRKHTINVKPAERVSFDITYDEVGNFAFHCHLLYHMEAGMFRYFNVSPGNAT